MPYADPDKQREAKARWYRERYNSDRKFRNEEAARKADWLQTAEGKDSNNESSKRFVKTSRGRALNNVAVKKYRAKKKRAKRRATS